MGYLDKRLGDVTELHNIYNPNMPDYIKELLDVPELLRLHGISQNCGVNLTKFGTFNYKYSRLDHSLGVALILSKFTNDYIAIISGLLYDIASPAFAHSVDFLNKDYIKQESTEYGTYDAIVGSDMLFEYFLKNDIPINDICDDSEYSLANSEAPKLCADRLEYLLHAAYYMRICDMSEIKTIYDDIVVVPNEDNKPEFAFETINLGRIFCRLSIEAGKKYRSYESKVAMQFIADLLKRMIDRKEISLKDLYIYTDKAILEMGLGSSDKCISDGWKRLQNMDKVYTRFNPVEGKYCVKVSAKSRYVDPLIRVKGGYIRVSKAFEENRKEIEAFLNSDTDLYMYIDE